MPAAIGLVGASEAGVVGAALDSAALAGDMPGSAAPVSVTVELFGVPRLLAGKKVVSVPWHEGLTVREALAALAGACPALVGPVLADQTGTLSDGYLLSVGGRSFAVEWERALAAHSTVLLIAAAAGGSLGPSCATAGASGATVGGACGMLVAAPAGAGWHAA